MTARTSRQGPTRVAMSAGGVVYRREGDLIEVVLVARPRQQLWALPKGTPEAGETVEQTAIREVTEETGLLVQIERQIGSISYWYAASDDHTPVRKTVHHYLMTPIGGSVDLHDHEYDVVDWLDIHEALARMSYQNERNIVEQAGALIREQAL